MSARVSFKVTTCFKRPRNEGGPTRVHSQPVDAGRALGWILAELPDDAYEMRVRWASRADAMVAAIEAAAAGGEE